MPFAPRAPTRDDAPDDAPAPGIDTSNGPGPDANPNANARKAQKRQARRETRERYDTPNAPRIDGREANHIQGRSFFSQKKLEGSPRKRSKIKGRRIEKEKDRKQATKRSKKKQKENK
jgi:hypothetical protein